MNVLWGTTEALSVRDLVERLPGEPAYTTVLTVVTHLYEKSWVDRLKHRRAYLYRPAHSQVEATARALRELVDNSDDPAAVLLHFARTASETESEALHRGLRDGGGTDR
ncbi:penicillinase repressor [Nocardia seriolae]|nr:penicillinase repressor [Nocardia seriolae]